MITQHMTAYRQQVIHCGVRRGGSTRLLTMVGRRQAPDHDESRRQATTRHDAIGMDRTGVRPRAPEVHVSGNLTLWTTRQAT